MRSSPDDRHARAPSQDTYRQRRSAFDAEERRLARVSFRFSLLRGGLFVGFVACLGVILVRAGSLTTPGWWIAAAVWLVVFFAVLPLHDRVIGEQRRAADLRGLNDEALLRIERAWDRLPIPSVAVAGADGPLARDLDLFGRASLFQLLGTAHTPAGKAMLAGWLLRPAPPEEIARRQAAVGELATEVDFRQRIEVRTRSLENKPPDLERFLQWAEGEPWLLARPALVWLTRLLPLATVGLALAAAVTDLPAWPALACVTVNLCLSYAMRERMEETLNRVQAREGELLRFAEAMEVVGRAACVDRGLAADRGTSWRRRANRRTGGWTSCTAVSSFRTPAMPRCSISRSSSSPCGTSTWSGCSKGGSGPSGARSAPGSRRWARSKRSALSAVSASTIPNGPFRPSPPERTASRPATSGIRSSRRTTASATMSRSARPAPSSW